MDQTTQERGKLQNFQRMRRLVLALIIAALVIALLFVRSAWGEEGHEFIEAIGIGTASLASMKLTQRRRQTIIYGSSWLGSDESWYFSSSAQTSQESPRNLYRISKSIKALGP